MLFLFLIPQEVVDPQKIGNRTQEGSVPAQNEALHSTFLCYRLQANNAGDYFPIWGTCQGFQQLSVLTAKKNLLTVTDTQAVALPLTFTPGTISASSTCKQRGSQTVGGLTLSDYKAEGG